MKLIINVLAAIMILSQMSCSKNVHPLEPKKVEVVEKHHPRYEKGNERHKN